MAAQRFFAIVNPAAGGGRCAKLAPAALERLRSAGIELDTAETHASGDATRFARDAHRRGERNFLAVGGDGTSYEIINGIFPQAATSPNGRCTLAFLPLGTGNSFLRDFQARQVSSDAAALVQSLLKGEKRSCDVIRLHHSTEDLFYINLLTLGFAADAAEFANRHLKAFGYTGYAISVLACLARLNRRVFPLRANGAAAFDRRRCLFLAFSNTKFTGGNMMIAPNADSSDGLIEYVRWGPIGRIGLLRNFSTLFDGAHVNHPLASHAAVREVEFALDEAVNVMIDGESLRLKCERLNVLPGVLDVIV